MNADRGEKRPADGAVGGDAKKARGDSSDAETLARLPPAVLDVDLEVDPSVEPWQLSGSSTGRCEAPFPSAVVHVAQHHSPENGQGGGRHELMVITLLKLCFNKQHGLHSRQ